MSEIFISYAREDRERIEALAAALEGEGFSIWWDRRIDAGAEFTKEIEEALAAAKAVIVAWSAAGNASTWVRDEASFARNAGTLLPIRLDESDPPLGFQQFHAFDFTKWRGDPTTEEFATLVASLRRRVVGEAAAPAPAPASGSRGFLARLRGGPAPPIGAAALVAAIVAGAFIFKSDTNTPPPAAAPTKKALADSAAAEAARKEGVGLAVLPFANLSSDPEQEFFADGLTEEILNWLGNVEGLRVPGRTTSFQFKGKADDLRAIGQTLNVGYILEGSVRRSGEKLRITAQLIDAKSGDHLWSEAYDRALADIFDIQTEIARTVVTELLGKIPETGIANPAAVGDVDPRAHELYLEGRALWTQRQHATAFAKFREATEIDAGHALAQAYLAVVGAHALGNRFSFPGFEKDQGAIVANALAEAVRLKPQAADVLFAQGWVADSKSGFAEPTDATAIRSYERAVRANPRHVEALHALARAQLTTSAMESIELYERVLAIDAGHYAARGNLIGVYLEAGERDKALLAARQGMTLAGASRRLSADLGWALGDMALIGEALFGDFGATEREIEAQWLRAAALASLGAVDEARFLYEKTAERESAPYRELARINAAVLEGNRAAALVLAKEIHELDPPPDFAAVVLAAALIGSGEPARAYDVLLGARPDLADHEKVTVGIRGRELVTAAHALDLAGRREEARALWREGLVAAEAGSGRLWEDFLYRALFYGNLGDRSQAVKNFAAAYDAGFRYLRSYDEWMFVEDSFYAEDGLFAHLMELPEIVALVEKIKAENAATLEEFNKRYGVLDKVDAMMAAGSAAGDSD